MTPEQEKKLNEALKYSKENNEMLHKMRRSMFWAKVFKIVYLVIILGATLGAYYFLQPYVESLLNFYGNFSGGAQGGQQQGTALPDFARIFRSFGN